MARKIRKNILTAFWLSMISSFFLFISGTTGVAGWMQIEDIVLRYLSFEWIDTIFIFLLLIASFGGFAVFFGGILLLKNKILLGNLLIALGSGAGLIGFVLNLAISILTLNLSIYSYLSFSSLGVLFAISAQFFSKKKKK